MKTGKLINTKLRWFINILLLVAMILTIIFGSIFYLKPKMQCSTLNVTSIKSVLKITETSNQNLDNKKLPKQQNILNTTKQYLEKANSLSSYDVSLSGKNLLEVIDYNGKTEAEKQKLVSSLVNKPYLTFTDQNGDPIFYRGRYQSLIEKDPNRKTFKDFIQGDPADFMPWLKESPANYHNSKGYSNRVSLNFTKEGWSEYIRWGNESYILYYYRGAAASNAYVWTNLKEFYETYKDEIDSKWGGNPVKFAYADGRIAPEEIKPKENEKDKKAYTLNPYLKSIASKYLISAAHPLAMVPSDSALSSYIYIYNENKNGYTDAELARIINYSMSPFELVQEYSYFVTTNKAVTNKYLVILAIMFSLFAVFLIIRYRFFGFLSLLSLLFFIFILLTAIIALGIKITPIVAIAIIVSVIVAFDLIHNTLDSMKKAINEGSNASKAIAKARKTTLIPSLDVIFVLLVYSIFNIYINLSQNYAISLILFASSIISLAISIILNTLILRSWVKLEIFYNRIALVSWRNKSYQKAYNVNLMSKSKYFPIGFALFAIISIIVVLSIGFSNHSLISGINLNSELRGEYQYMLMSNKNSSIPFFDESNVNTIQEALKSSPDLKNAIISQVVLEKFSTNTNYAILIRSKTDIENTLVTFQGSLPILAGSKLIANNIQPMSIGYDIATFAIIFFSSFALISIYVMIRYSWVATIILWIKALFVGILTFVILFTSYGLISYSLFDGLMLGTVFVIYDSIINFSKIKEELSKDLNTKNTIYSKEKLQLIFKEYIVNIFSRQLILVLSAAILLPICIIFMNLLNKSIILITSFSIISIALINFFMLPLIWCNILVQKYKMKEKRIKNNFWKNVGVEEQTFSHINDFSM